MFPSARAEGHGAEQILADFNLLSGLRMKSSRPIQCLCFVPYMRVRKGG
jgi:hypothetical protein